MRADRTPERRGAFRVEMAAQFRAQTLRKTLAKLREKHEAGTRQQTAYPARAITRTQEQRTHFGVTREVMRNIQRAHACPDAEILARVHDRAHAVVVERLLQTHCCFDAAYAGHVAGLGVFHHEEI